MSELAGRGRPDQEATDPSAVDASAGTRVIEAENGIEQLGALALEFGRRALIVTDEGLVTAGHVERAEASLRAADVEHERFSDLVANPTTDDVELCVRAMRSFQPDLLIALGGGSCMDVAKGANFIHCCGGRLEDYWGVEKATADLLPMIAVPTTAGTGSEVQSFALIARAEDHQKMACGDSRAAPRIALLDPTLTTSLSAFVTACTGIDAIGHAVEALVTTKGTEVSTRLAREAFLLADRAFPRVIAEPDSLAGRGQMLRAAALAGRAIENSMLGAAHSMANPLTAQHGVPHGQAVGMCLPFVVRFNATDPRVATAYAELARAAGLAAAGSSDDAAVDALHARLVEYLRLASLPTSLADCGVELGGCGALAEEAARQWTAQFNPREIDVQGFTDLFLEACA
ncbi:MAG: alcohol dehydrogenase [Chlamydiales bacterium]|jgi:alcohol dehydrogenase